MEPKKVGRTLGIGVRVASNMLRERVERAAAAHPAPAGGGKWAVNRLRAAPGRHQDRQQGGGRQTGAKGLRTGFSGPVYPRRQYTLAGNHRAFFCLVCAFFCPERLSRARSLEARAGTQPSVALCGTGRSVSHGFRSVPLVALTARAGAGLVQTWGSPELGGIASAA